MLRIFLALGAVFFLREAAAVSKALDFTIHQEYTSTRALGMGNAFIAVADDHSALFYNPAALARRKDGQVRMFLRGGLDKDYLNFVDEIEAANDKPTEAEKIDAMSELIEKNYGNHYYSRVPTIGAVWVRPRWGIAFIPADMSIDIGIHQQVGPMLNVNGYLDSTLAYGYARNIKGIGKDQTLSVGVTVKALHRINVSQALIAAELATNSKVFDTKDANEGMTVDGDIGLLYDPGYPSRGWFKFLKYAKPSFAFVARNVADYGFPTNFHFVDENSGEPPNLGRRFDVGSNWKLPSFWVFDPHLAIDLRDMGHENWTWRKGFHAGAELYWTMYKWWKGSYLVGLNQGYWTAGIGLHMGWFQLDVSSWGEEVGTTDVPKESRRYIMEMSIDF